MRKNLGREFLAFILCFLILSGTIVKSATIQDDSRAAKIYRDCSGSVLLLTIKSEQGEILGKATGFVVQGGVIITNEHVVRNGQVFVESGVASIPVSTQTTDAYNDLAVLKPGIELAVAPLPISNAVPSPGDPVYTISNPVGLEKSLSTGVVSNVREFDGRRLIQITAPISHGSSGGPVLNGLGEVIGVAVGMLKDGQNLNFAVPAEKLAALLSGKPDEVRDTLSMLSEVETLKSELAVLGYSSDAESDYQRTLGRIRASLQSALAGAGQNTSMLLKVAEMSPWFATDISLSAAEKAVSVSPNFDTKFMLGTALARSRWTGDDGQKAALLKRAENAFRDCMKLAKSPNADLLYALADVLEYQSSHIEAERYFTEALGLYKTANSRDGHAKSIRALIRTSYALGKADAGDAWFRTLSDLDYAAAWDWQLQGSRLEAAGKFHQAGLCFQRSAEIGEDWMWRNWLGAAWMFLLSMDDYDAALYCARKGLTAGAETRDSEIVMSFAHRIIAIVLNLRGVYQEAFSHARESVALNPEDEWAYHNQAEALIGLQRYLESVNASQQAIRLSDGKHATMHFMLASAYFELENWELSQQSFRKAAELEPEDSASPYNVALCMENLRFYRDAVKWYEEVLRRNPKRPDRQDILRRIEILRRTP